MVSETKKSCMDTNSWVSSQTWLAYEEDKYHCKSNKTQSMSKLWKKDEN